MQIEQVFSFNNLLKAHRECRLGKQHKRETILFEISLSENLQKMHKEICSGTYKIGGYHMFYVKEPKVRKIECLCYKHRVALMCLCTNALGPYLESHLIYDCVACRKNKGTLFGIERLKTFLQKHMRTHGEEGFYLKCDIKKFFQSINQQVLCQQIKQANFSKGVEDFLIMVVTSCNAQTGIGLPIGNQTSQWFALMYLNPVDRLIKEKLKIKYYIRYMDDFVLIHHSKSYLKFCLQEITKVLNALKLQLNSKTQLMPLNQGIDFLGFHFKIKNKKIVQTLRQQAKIRLKRKLKHLKIFEKFPDGKTFISVRINAYKAHLMRSNSFGYYLTLLNRNNLPIPQEKNWNYLPRGNTNKASGAQEWTQFFPRYF